MKKRAEIKEIISIYTDIDEFELLKQKQSDILPKL